MRPMLIVSPVSDGVPEPDDGLLYGCLNNSESLEKLDELLDHLSSGVSWRKL